MVEDYSFADHPTRNLLTPGEAAALSRVKVNVYLDTPDAVDLTWRLPWVASCGTDPIPALTTGDKAVYNELWMAWCRAMGLE